MTSQFELHRVAVVKVSPLNFRFSVVEMITIQQVMVSHEMGVAII